MRCSLKHRKTKLKEVEFFRSTNRVKNHHKTENMLLFCTTWTWWRVSRWSRGDIVDNNGVGYIKEYVDYSEVDSFVDDSEDDVWIILYMILVKYIWNNYCAVKCMLDESWICCIWYRSFNQIWILKSIDWLLLTLLNCIKCNVPGSPDLCENLL